MAETDRPEEHVSVLQDLPPSCAAVYLALENVGESTLQPIVEEACATERTVRYALDRLSEEGVVEERPDVRDARKSVYEIID